MGFEVELSMTVRVFWEADTEMELKVQEFY